MAMESGRLNGPLKALSHAAFKRRQNRVCKPRGEGVLKRLLLRALGGV